MGKQRKQYQAAFKSKVALEAIKGVRTVNEIATHYGVHPTQVVQWKKQALDHLREAFSDGRKNHEVAVFGRCETSTSLDKRTEMYSCSRTLSMLDQAYLT